MGIGTKKIVQIGIVVKNIEKSRQKWTKALGFVPDIDQKVPKWSHTPTYTYGKPEDDSDVIMVKFDLDDNINIALFQPSENPSPWKTHLDQYGESVMFLGFDVPDRQATYDALGHKPYHIGYYPDITYSMVDTMEDLGIELNIKSWADNTALITRLISDPDNNSEEK